MNLPPDYHHCWNMQYFGTAQGAVCTAIHSLLLQAHGDEIRLFPALPAGWMEAEFDNLLEEQRVRWPMTTD